MSSWEYEYKFNHPDPLLKEGHENNNRALRRLNEILQASGNEFDIVTRDELSEELISGYDAVISAGGDGTVIAVAAYNKDKPQLNLKSEEHSIGALCQHNLENALESFLAGNYRIENWTREEVLLDGKFISRALNETSIGKLLRFDKQARLEVSFLDEESNSRKEYIEASGLIIATGTGSTGWKVFKPYPRDSKYFELYTVLLYSGSLERARSLNFKIQCKNYDGKFAVDTCDYSFPRNSILEIRLSDSPLKVIIPNINQEKSVK